MKKVITSGIIVGLALFVVCYGGLFVAIRLFPHFFEEYISTMFNSDGSRDFFFYTHVFVISFALSMFWKRFKIFFKGHSIIRGLEFGGTYAIVSLLPIFWLSYSTLDITFKMVASWFIYGLIQATVAGVILSKTNP